MRRRNYLPAGVRLCAAAERLRAAPPRTVHRRVRQVAQRRARRVRRRRPRRRVDPTRQRATRRPALADPSGQPGRGRSLQEHLGRHQRVQHRAEPHLRGRQLRGLALPGQAEDRALRGHGARRVLDPGHRRGRLRQGGPHPQRRAAGARPRASTRPTSTPAPWTSSRSTRPPARRPMASSGASRATSPPSRSTSTSTCIDQAGAEDPRRARQERRVDVGQVRRGLQADR